MTKICRNCRKVKDSIEFAVRGDNQLLYYSWCFDCLDMNNRFLTPQEEDINKAVIETRLKNTETVHSGRK